MEYRDGDDSWVIRRVRGDLFELRNLSPYPRVGVHIQRRGGEPRRRKDFTGIEPGEAVQFTFLSSPRLQTDDSYVEIDYREIRDQGGIDGFHMDQHQSPVSRTADVAAQMDAAGQKVTVPAVRAHAGVSTEAARLGVEQRRAASRQPEIPVPGTMQRAFAGVWAAAVSDAAARHQTDRDAARELVAAATAEEEKNPAAGTAQRAGRPPAGERRAAPEALEARESPAEAHGTLAVPQEQAALHWNKASNTAPNKNQGTEK